MKTTTPYVLHTVDTKPWYRYRWPWLLMLGPTAVVLAGIVTTWLAFSRPDALVVDDYYKQGKAINQDLRRDRAASSLRMHAALRYDAAGGKLHGALSSAGNPHVGKINLRLVHSTRPEKDILLRMQTESDGKFAAALPLLDIAQWQVVIEDDERKWRLTGRWSWPRQNAVELKSDAL